MTTAIPYAKPNGESWSIVTGCSMKCPWCWSRAIAHRFGRSFSPTFHADKLAVPLHWRKPRTVVVAFNGDLFDDAITLKEIGRVFATMAACQKHRFLVLTKRALRMEAWFSWMKEMEFADVRPWPLPNVWIGVSVTNQAEADERIPHLLRCPAAVRWVSAEPLLGPLNLTPWIDYCEKRDMRGIVRNEAGQCSRCDAFCGVSWVVAGPQSGPNAPRVNLAWAYDIRDQCAEAGVPFAWKNPTGFQPLDGVVHDATPGNSI